MFTCHPGLYVQLLWQLQPHTDVLLAQYAECQAQSVRQREEREERVSE